MSSLRPELKSDIHAEPVQSQTNEALQSENAERKRAEWQLNIQYAVSRVLAESSTLKQASSNILRTICEHMNWDVGAFWNVDGRTRVMRFYEIWSTPNFPIDEFATLSRQTTLARGSGLPGRVWASGKPSWIPDVVVDANFPRAAAAKQVGLHGAFASPIWGGNKVVGVIEFFSREIRHPDEDLLRMFTTLGSQLGQFFERKRLEEQLIQSQKMETVGKLAGGIAHEFNSIMTAIIGQSELLMGDLPSGTPLSRNAQEIRKAADRAATLTRQLLAYGRKQIFHPELLDLNNVVTNMDEVLRNLMGCDVDLRLVPYVGLKAVKADAGQIEQVILNMAMNARDAMPHGGKLTIEVSNVTLDRQTMDRALEMTPGDYVMIAITDTGTGMNEEVKKRIFEPFFTTKGVGKGTRLGLATCYGIIKQSGGQITVYSELGKGTCFKIYLPQAERPTATLAAQSSSPQLPQGTETILLVEDDPSLREMSTMLLKRLGYQVLPAANGTTALSLLEQRDKDCVDLLFTDVVMPEMGGKELSERIVEKHPGTRVLFTSAYTENSIVHQGALNEGVALLQKPFTPSALAFKVREVLNSNGKK